MNAGPAGSAASRSRARLGLGSAAAEREVYKAAPGNKAASRRGRPGPSRRPVGARHCLAAGAREGAAGSGARRGSARGDTERCPGRPASPAIATDAGDAGPPPSRPSATLRTAAAARPLLEDAVASPRAGPLSRAPRLLGSRAFQPVHDPKPRILPALPGPQLPGSSCFPGACPPHPPRCCPPLSAPDSWEAQPFTGCTPPLPDACCPQILILLPMPGPPSATAYATPRASPRRWQGWGFCHTVCIWVSHFASLRCLRGGC